MVNLNFKKIFTFLLLIVSVFWVASCAGQPAEDAAPGASLDVAAETNYTPYQPSIVVQWNELALAAIRQDPSRPTVITRSLFMVHTAMFDAWSAYDGTAEPVAMVDGMRRVESERTVENQTAAVAQAAYHTLVHLYPEFEKNTGSFSHMLAVQGYEPDFEVNSPMLATDVGLFAAQSVIDSRKFDGANEDNDYVDMTSDFLPEPYTATNAPDRNLPGTAGYDPTRWQPLRVPTGVAIDEFSNPVIVLGDPITFFDQTFTTPHWGAVSPFALESGNQYRPPAPPLPGSEEPYIDARGNRGSNDAIFQMQLDEVVVLSANLTDEHKVIAEYWADGPRSETPPGHWNALAHGISERDHHSLDQDIKFYFSLNCALFDAGIAAWEAKRHFDYVRPVSAIHHKYSGEMIEAWGGPNRGTQMILGEVWAPYQQSDFVTPPFPEYVSGHSAFSAAAAEVFTRFTGSNRYYDGETVLYHSDFNHDGVPDLLGQHIVPVNGNLFEKSPSSVIVLQWETFQDAADEAGLSRLYGGIHFAEGDLNGRILGKQVADVAYEKAKSHWTSN